MKSHRCPTCGKVLTKTEWEKALRIHGERERHLAHQARALNDRERAQRIREREFKRDAKKKLAEERTRIRSSERARASRQQVGLQDTIQKLRERLRQRERGTTPQTEGLEFEEKLTARLKREFPEDAVLHKGKGGDILQTVMVNRKPAGIIIYECKRTPRIDESHIVQANAAKQQREADFAVLVTTGRKKGFNGFAQMAGVSVVSPLAAVPLAALLRGHLIEMARLKITREKRAALAQQLAQYIGSPQFRNPLEEVVSRVTKLQGMIRKEATLHRRVWKERWEHYTTIGANTSQIQNNLKLVMHGEQPKQITRIKASPLALPAPE